MASYTVAFKEQAVQKVLSGSPQTTISSVANDIGISYQTLRQWVERYHQVVLANSEISGDMQVNSVLSTLNLPPEAQSTYCRRHGLLPQKLEEWTLEMKEQLAKPQVSVDDYNKLQQEFKEEKKALEQQLAKQAKELRRKEKALAEAAALLVLQKKVQEIWGDEEPSQSHNLDNPS